MPIPLAFAAWFTSTVLVVRVALWLRPMPSPTVLGRRLHHWMFELAGLGAGLALGSVPLSAVGLGLFVDEATFLLMGGRTHADNYSFESLAGTFALVFGVDAVCLLLSVGP